MIQLWVLWEFIQLKLLNHACAFHKRAHTFSIRVSSIALGGMLFCLWANVNTLYSRDRKLLSEKTHAFCCYYCFWRHQQMMSKPEISRYFFCSAFEWISWLSNSFQTRNISSCYFLYIWILAYAVWERQDWIYWYGVGASTHRSLMLQICCFVRFLAGQCIK